MESRQRREAMKEIHTYLDEYDELMATINAADHADNADRIAADLALQDAKELYEGPAGDTARFVLHAFAATIEELRQQYAERRINRAALAHELQVLEQVAHSPRIKPHLALAQRFVPEEPIPELEEIEMQKGGGAQGVRTGVVEQEPSLLGSQEVNGDTTNEIPITVLGKWVVGREGRQLLSRKDEAFERRLIMLRYLSDLRRTHPGRVLSAREWAEQALGAGSYDTYRTRDDVRYIQEVLLEVSGYELLRRYTDDNSRPKYTYYLSLPLRITDRDPSDAARATTVTKLAAEPPPATIRSKRKRKKATPPADSVEQQPPTPVIVSDSAPRQLAGPTNVTRMTIAADEVIGADTENASTFEVSQRYFKPDDIALLVYLYMEHIELFETFRCKIDDDLLLNLASDSEVAERIDRYQQQMTTLNDGIKVLMRIKDRSNAQSARRFVEASSSEDGQGQYHRSLIESIRTMECRNSFTRLIAEVQRQQGATVDSAERRRLEELQQLRLTKQIVGLLERYADDITHFYSSLEDTIPLAQAAPVLRLSLRQIIEVIKNKPGERGELSGRQAIEVLVYHADKQLASALRSSSRRRQLEQAIERYGEWLFAESD